MQQFVPAIQTLPGIDGPNGIRLVQGDPASRRHDETLAETVDFDQRSITARTAGINQGVHTAPLGQRFNRRFYPSGASCAGWARRVYHSYERRMTNGYPKNLRLEGLAPPRATSDSMGSVTFAVMRVDSARTSSA